VRQELVVAVERELEPVEERLRIQLPDIVRVVHRQLLQTFQQLRTPPDSVTAPGVSDHPQPPAITAEQAQDGLEPLAFQLTAEDDQLGPFWNDAFVISTFAGIDAFSFQDQLLYPLSGSDASDPGYRTMSNSAAALVSDTSSAENYLGTKSAGKQKQPDIHYLSPKVAQEYEV
jgi:hypothetical protein